MLVSSYDGLEAWYDPMLSRCGWLGVLNLLLDFFDGVVHQPVCQEYDLEVLF